MSTTTTRPLTPGRRATLIVGGFFALALIVFGAWTAASALGITTEERHLTLSPAGHRLTIDADGDIQIRAGSDEQVRVTERIRHSIGRPQVTENTTQDGIELRGQCPWYTSTCRVNIEITMPPELSVNVRTSAGNIMVTGVEGQVRLVSSAGDVRATGLRAGSAEARSSAGSVVLVFEAPPSAVTAHSSAGDVDIRLPPVDGGYRVHADTSAGTRSVDVSNRPESRRTIDATTSAGDVSVSPR